MYKIAIIGDRESVLAFMALGFSVYEAENKETAAGTLRTLAESGECAVIFLTEDLAAQLPEELARYKDSPLPAVTVIPGKGGSRGMGLAAIRESVVRAVGADILKD